MPQVTIGKLRGQARGGGAELFSAFDMRFASLEQAGLSQPECRMGLLPGAGATAYLADVVGRARALEIILDGQLVDAATAERIGWINRAVPDADLDNVVDSLATRIANLAPGVARAAIEAIDTAAQSTAQGLKKADELISHLFKQPEADRLGKAALAAGAQTRDGDRHYEDVLNSIAGNETSPK